VLAGPVVVMIIITWMWLKLMRKKNKPGEHTTTSLFVIKYFDNDELTFTRAKSRLFVEK
jgi:hypothetical protein